VGGVGRREQSGLRSLLLALFRFQGLAVTHSLRPEAAERGAESKTL